MISGNWLRRKIREYYHTVDSLGVFNALHFQILGFLARRSSARRPIALRSKHAKFPVWCRPHSSDLSDLFVFHDIFIDLQYACVDHVGDPTLIIDCGAHVGYASAYFLSRFPEARVIAIEPDPSNFAMLQRNLEPYGERATVLRAGLWSHEVGLVVESQPGDGLEWATHVRKCGPGETPQLVATDVGKVLADSGASTISILKVDVEGAESVMFSDNYQEWLDRVENIVIELHGEDCTKIFDEAISGRSFQQSRSGELTFCERVSMPLTCQKAVHRPLAVAV